VRYGTISRGSDIYVGKSMAAIILVYVVLFPVTPWSWPVCFKRAFLMSYYRYVGIPAKRDLFVVLHTLLV
jgi:hypothetical protein